MLPTSSGRRETHARNKHEVRSKQKETKGLSTFTGPSDVGAQKMKVVIVAAVRISNPAQE
jgi:hypothetical protein